MACAQERFISLAWLAQVVSLVTWLHPDSGHSDQLTTPSIFNAKFWIKDKEIGSSTWWRKFTFAFLFSFILGTSDQINHNKINPSNSTENFSDFNLRRIYYHFRFLVPNIPGHNLVKEFKGQEISRKTRIWNQSYWVLGILSPTWDRHMILVL